MASLAGEHETILIARSDGLVVADVRPLVRMSITVIVEENGRREQGYSGGGGRFDYAYFTDEMLDAYARERWRRRCSTSGARRARGQHDGRAGQRLAGHSPARSDRARPRGRLQPQGNERVLRDASASASPRKA
jgi:hypothetical protein